MKTWISSIIIIVAVLLAGSLLSTMIMNNHHGDHHSIFSTIESKPYHEDSVFVSSVTHLPQLDTVSVYAEGRHFAVTNRENQITSFKCSECHNVPLAQLLATKPKMGEKSHWNIEIKHASKNVMNCTTCHSEGNMDKLHSITNEPISFNNSYQLCAQCHQTQYKDWVGGAHGKRIGGWAKPVVKNTCVDCHDPHGPSFPHKFPSRINTRMMEQRAKK
ncbi:MAG: cytochrome C [Salibacteraceae bacterium]